MSVAVFPEPLDLASFAEDLRSGLLTAGQRVLPSKYLYDEVGSTLFEVICVLPEYGLTRADTRLKLGIASARRYLRRRAGQWQQQEDPTDPGSNGPQTGDRVLSDRHLTRSARPVYT